MKRWQGILLAIALQAGQMFVPMIKNEQAKELASFTIMAISAGVAKKSSDTNPDGTPAEVAYTKEIK